MEPAAPPLERTLTLRGAVTLNLLDMIGVGPFITLPLLLSAMGGPQAMLGWVLGALLAACDGLVWAELGAAMPHAGGTYRYLAEIFPGTTGKWLSFLFVFQLCVTAPLSVASGCIGLAQYAASLAPSVGAATLVSTPLRESLVAVAAVLAAVALLYRRLAAMRGLAVGLLGLVLLTIAWAIVTGLLRGHAGAIFAFPHDAFRMNRSFFAGLGSAMLIATYDYWGYYNVTFLGGEVRNAGRTIPRAVLLSIGIVALLYVGLNASVLSVLGSPAIMAAGLPGARRALLSQFMQVAYAPLLGNRTAVILGGVAALLVMATAFASVFALLLGYSRIPFAAGRDGNFPAVFGKLHPTRGFPYVSLLYLAGAACICCFFSLAHVIAALVVVRILLQFGLQQVGVMVLRVRSPDMVRPFRLWLYPVPPLAALAGFVYIVVSRVHAWRDIAFSLALAVAGSALFFSRSMYRQARTPSTTEV